MTDLQEFQFKESHLFQLKDMGLSTDESKKALYNTQNQEIDEALKWIVKHFTDKDFDQPLHLSEHEKDDTDVAEALEAIVMMGFSDKQARQGIRGNNLEKAVDLILEEMDTDIGSDPRNFSKSKTKKDEKPSRILTRKIPKINRLKLFSTFTK
ncbi:uncharacterized protein [Parasteatoda tepidariorum]|uniref:uncharacterized protein n=1 Tax=Parasteatoda tepidariorum TaxID=114398 RepID=UPI001C724BA9|nr:ubiquitin carboxyl-terminal hydrolase 5-like [Parasteatoda tepidariorum]